MKEAASGCVSLITTKGTMKNNQLDRFLPTSATLLERIKNLDDDKSWQAFLDKYRNLVRSTALKAAFQRLRPTRRSKKPSLRLANGSKSLNTIPLEAHLRAGSSTPPVGRLRINYADGSGIPPLSPVTPMTRKVGLPRLTVFPILRGSISMPSGMRSGQILSSKLPSSESSSKSVASSIRFLISM